MVRITHSGYTRVRTLDLDGKLVGPWVDELRRIVGAPNSGDTLCLNLQQLTFADADGLALLRELRHDGVQLAGALPLIESLLALPSGSDAESAPGILRA